MPLDRGVDLSLAPLKGEAEDDDRNDERGERQNERQSAAKRVRSKRDERADKAEGAEDDVNAAVQEQPQGDEADVDQAEDALAESDRRFGTRQRAPQRRCADEMQPEAEVTAPARH